MAPQSSSIPSSVGSAVGRGARVGGAHMHAVEGDPVHREDLRRIENHRRRRQGSDDKYFSWNLPCSEVNNFHLCRSSPYHQTHCLLASSPHQLRAAPTHSKGEQEEKHCDVSADARGGGVEDNRGGKSRQQNLPLRRAAGQRNRWCKSIRSGPSSSAVCES